MVTKTTKDLQIRCWKEVDGMTDEQVEQALMWEALTKEHRTAFQQMIDGVRQRAELMKKLNE